MTESYVCPHCGRLEDRPYRVRLIILTCPDCGLNGRFIHESLVERLDEIPDADRPDDWSEMPLDDRLRFAIEEGLLEISFTGPL
ncbi:hypothetical protein [Halobellus marinus]|uniref:hypothetical protein n=1 Tax=Halobellus TaxID=1073986 RepID=UPI0028AB9B60|nr:hypothetical protein [Halobellus sp. DFY28]